jgi:hypothetical protein
VVPVATACALRRHLTKSLRAITRALSSVSNGRLLNTFFCKPNSTIAQQGIFHTDHPISCGGFVRPNVRKSHRRRRRWPWLGQIEISHPALVEVQVSWQGRLVAAPCITFNAAVVGQGLRAAPRPHVGIAAHDKQFYENARGNFPLKAPAFEIKSASQL